jgi:hypothetical protein
MMAPMWMLQLLVDGGRVDEHVVVVLVDDHEVVAVAGTTGSG